MSAKRKSYTPKFRTHLRSGALATIGEEPIKILSSKPLNLFGCRQSLVVEHPARPGNRPVRTTRHRLDLPISQPLQQQAHHIPVISHLRTDPSPSPRPQRSRMKAILRAATRSPHPCYQIDTQAPPEAPIKHIGTDQLDHYEGLTSGSRGAPSAKHSVIANVPPIK